MTNTLLGLADLIGKAIGAVFEALVVPVLKIILELILTPIINITLTVTKYALAAVGYIISSFLLKLIDFVEILFRALAGLPAKEGADFSVGLSIDGDQGDILIQLLRNHDIQQAFLSMCIVGLFLLVVTTVFQIIKVEYTTEGAKNAKGPIFQKAFKGAANLMLLPLLVVFGIVFANQLLNLLDKATSVNGNNPTISGLLFVSAASDAHYVEGEEQPEDLKDQDKVVDGAVTLIVLSITDAISEALDVVFSGGSANEPSAEYIRSAEERAKIDDNFVSQTPGYKYYNIKQVTTYYNYPSINYILLLFGSVFVLKALFFTCFGMVIRLYKCAILFIISPAVIGMTPINEGGLGKWRTAFIGQVLSAYGTILSINLFFVVVRVLLSIDVTFTMNNTDFGGAGANFLGDTFMTLILKSIFVMAGVLLIEKFSKELGGYFGAEDAMGAGKDMANQVGDLAMKGVGAAAMVASGGASLAMKAGKAAGGIANKVSKGIGNTKTGAGIKAGRAAYKESMKNSKGSIMSSSERRAEAKKAKSAASTKAKNDITAQRAARELDQKDEQLKRVTDRKSQYEEKYKGRDMEYWDENDRDDYNFLTQRESDLKSDKMNVYKDLGRDTGVSAKDQKKLLDNARKTNEKKDAEKAEQKNLNRGKRVNKLLNAVSMVEGFAEEGRSSLPGAKYFKKANDNAAKGSKLLGDSFETAHNSVVFQKGKEKQDNASKMFSGAIGKAEVAAATLLTVQATKELGTQMSQMSREVIRELQNIARMREANVDERIVQQREMSVVDSLQKQGSTLDYQGLKDLQLKLKAEGEIGVKDLNIVFDPKKIEKAVVDAVNKGATSPDEIRRVIIEELEKVGLAGNANLIKMISDTFEKHIGNIKK